MEGGQDIDEQPKSLGSRECRGGGAMRCRGLWAGAQAGGQGKTGSSLERCRQDRPRGAAEGELPFWARTLNGARLAIRESNAKMPDHRGQKVFSIPERIRSRKQGTHHRAEFADGEVAGWSDT